MLTIICPPIRAKWQKFNPKKIVPRKMLWKFRSPDFVVSFFFLLMAFSALFLFSFKYTLDRNIHKIWRFRVWRRILARRRARTPTFFIAILCGFLMESVQNLPLDAGLSVGVVDWFVDASDFDVVPARHFVVSHTTIVVYLLPLH